MATETSFVCFDSNDNMTIQRLFDSSESEIVGFSVFLEQPS